MYIDCRNKQCPIPVLEVKKAIEQVEANITIHIDVDNEIATENLAKFALQTNCTYEIKKIDENNYQFYISKGSDLTIDTQINLEEENFVLVIDSLYLGSDKEVGEKLMNMYLYTLAVAEKIPTTIFLLNEGVKLASTEEEQMEHLRKIEQRGTKIFSCGACLGYFGIMAEVGETTNMMVIINEMNNADRLIKL